MNGSQLFAVWRKTSILGNSQKDQEHYEPLSAYCWQIGRTYRYFEPDDASALTEARIAAVKRVAELATQHQCDAVLVAGDVFDMQGVGERLIRQTLNAMAGFSGSVAGQPRCCLK